MFALNFWCVQHNLFFIMQVGQNFFQKVTTLYEVYAILLDIEHQLQENIL